MAGDALPQAGELSFALPLDPPLVGGTTGAATDYRWRRLDAAASAAPEYYVNVVYNANELSFE